MAGSSIRPVVMVIAALGLGAPLVRSQPEVAPAGQMDLPRLVDLAAQRLHLNLQYDPAALKTAGAVTLRLEAPVSDRELWDLLNGTLAERGFTTVRTPGGFSILKLADAANVSRLVSDGPEPEPLPGFRSVTVHLTHQPAKTVVDAVTKVLSKPGGSVAAVAEGLVIISDLSPRVDQALELVKLLDVPAGAALVEEIPVRNLSAQALAMLVAQVVAKRDAVSGQKTPGEVLPSPNGNALLLVAPAAGATSWRNLVRDLDQREKVETATYAPRAFSIRDVGALIEQTVKDAADERWKMVPDELTGSLIITATPRQHEKVRALLQRLDAGPAATQHAVRSFVIKNRPVRDLLEILEHMVSAGLIGPPPDTGRNGPGPSESAALTPWPPPTPPAVGQVPAPPLSSVSKPQTSSGTRPGEKEPRVVFTADEGTNTLIALGEPGILAQIESLLKSLDIRQPQVMLEVLILSLSDSQTLDLGVELEKLITSGDTRITLASLFGLSTRNAGGEPTLGSAAGFTGIVLNPGDFSVVLRALQTLNQGRSLSMPRLLVANNQQATLDSVLTQPYASTNASNTVTTTSFGGSQDAGTQVTLKPQIAAGGGGDHLNLDYSISLSAFVGAPSTANLPPPRQQNKVQSAASLPDGYTVVVGGIDLTSEGKATSQVPGLGAIPVLGEVFKNRSKNASRSRFYVFIRANILRSSSFEDLKYVSDVASTAAGVDDGFPVVEPRVIR